MADPASEPRLIFVLGMHRSGTSALTRVLNLGGYALPRNLLGANQDNPHGYWEPADIVAFNDVLLDRFGRHWADPKPLPEGWQARVAAATGRAAALLEAELARTGNRGAGLVLKDPRFCLTLPVWRTAAELCGVDPACLIIHRDPEDCFRSLHSRDRFSRDHALRLWLRYVLDAEAGSRGLRRAFVSYDALLDDWREAVPPALAAAGLPGWDRMSAAEDRIDGFLTKNARHHHRSAPGTEDGDDLAADLRRASGWMKAFPAGQNPEPMNVLRRRDAAYWQSLSPGPERSGLPQKLPGFHAETAWAHAREDRVDEAIAAAARAAEIAPDIMRFHFIEGTMLNRAGRFDEAAASLRRALACDDSQARVHRALAQTLSGLGDPQSAADAMTAALKCDDRNAADHHELGRFLMQAKRPRPAVEAYRRAIACDPGKQAYHLSLATALRFVGGRAERAEALEAAARLGPLSADRADELGEAQALLGRLARAVAAYDAGRAARWRALGLGGGPDQQAAPARGGMPANVRLTELTKALARSGAAHWAKDLAAALPYDLPPDQAGPGAPWPLGRHLSAHRNPPLVDRTAGAPRKRLSVMLPVYRVERADWLREALDSVLGQIPDESEVVVVDDASPDPTARQVAEARGPRVRYLRNAANLGLIGNQNRCIEEAAGDLVHILHQDDRVRPGFYDALLPPLEADPALVAGLTHTGYIGADGQLMSQESGLQPRGLLENWAVRLTLQIRIQYPSILVRRSAYMAQGGFSPSLDFSFDWDMWNRIAASGPIWFEPEALGQYRVHEGSATYSFGWQERVQDAMRTVAYMQRLLAAEDRRAIAEFGFYKFFHRYWTLLGSEPPERQTDDQRALRDFLLSGWTAPDEATAVRRLLAQIQRDLTAGQG